MRWTHDSPEIGGRRERSRFLWLPLRIGDETRWLEWARYRQEYQQNAVPTEHGRWVDVEWISK